MKKNKAEFYVEKGWKTDSGIKALIEAKVPVENDFDREVACLTYPTIQFIYEAWLRSGEEPYAVTIDDEFGGRIVFSIFVVLKGNPPANRKELADDETGLMWESYEYINDIKMAEINFKSENWEKSLEAEMSRIAEIYIKNKKFSFEKANF